jgi:hypothetical protein
MYLGLIILTKLISMDEDKVETIQNWSQEKNTNNMQWNNLINVPQFVGFCNYDQQLIPKNSEKAEASSRLTKKDEQFK